MAQDRELELPPRFDIKVQPVPKDSPNLSYYFDKLEILGEIARAYNNSEEAAFERQFGALQQAAFSLADFAFLDGIKHDETKVLEIGDAAHRLPFLVSGRMPAPPSPPVVASDAATANPVMRKLRLMIRVFSSVNLARPWSSRRSQTVSEADGADESEDELEAHAQTVYPGGRDKITRKVDKRDRGDCVVTEATGGIDRVHIIPCNMKAGPSALDNLLSVLPITRMLFGEDFNNRLRTVLGAIEVSDGSWNTFTLHAYLSMLYQAGCIGFRPVKITDCVEEEISFFRVYFSIHWLGRTKMMLKKSVAPSHVSLSQMFSVLDKFREDRDKGHYSVCNPLRGTRIRDGDEFSIRFESRDHAEKMFDCFVLSWTVRIILFMAGGAGNPDDDPDDLYCRETV